MQKLINIDNDIYERIETIRKKFHIKTVQPVLDIIISMGLEAFERLINPPKEEKVYIWPWYPTQPIYPCYDDITPVQWKWNNGEWQFATGAGNWTINIGTGQQYGVNYDVSYNPETPDVPP